MQILKGDLDSRGASDEFFFQHGGLEDATGHPDGNVSNLRVRIEFIYHYMASPSLRLHF